MLELKIELLEDKYKEALTERGQLADQLQQLQVLSARGESGGSSAQIIEDARRVAAAKERLNREIEIFKADREQFEITKEKVKGARLSFITS